MNGTGLSQQLYSHLSVVSCDSACVWLWLHRLTWSVCVCGVSACAVHGRVPVQCMCVCVSASQCAVCVSNWRVCVCVCDWVCVGGPVCGVCVCVSVSVCRCVYSVCQSVSVSACISAWRLLFEYIQKQLEQKRSLQLFAKTNETAWRNHAWKLRSIESWRNGERLKNQSKAAEENWLGLAWVTSVSEAFWNFGDSYKLAGPANDYWESGHWIQLP